MTTSQKEIDDLLNDSLLESSVAIRPPSQIRESRPKEEDSYANEDFDDYEESRRTLGAGQSQSQNEQSKQMKKGAKLVSIQEEPSTQKGKAQMKKTVDVGEFKTQENFKKEAKGSTYPDKLHLAHNYARLEERERELLLTTLSEQNRQLKSELQQKTKDYQILGGKYKLLLEEKGQQNSTAKEMALEKKVCFLEEKLKKLSNLKNIQEQRNKYKTKLPNKTQAFIPEQECQRRESELLQLIDKLKHRLIQSDENMSVLHRKLNEQAEHNEELVRKMKRVEQLQYRMEKMTGQAETDRGFIELLKEKIKELEGKLQEQKNKIAKTKLEVKRLEMGQLTHSDIMEELKETRRQKELLEKSLKELSSTLVSKARQSVRHQENNIQDSEELLRT